MTLPMGLVTHELKASYAFIERNFNLTRRYWGWELAFLVYSVAGALSVSLIGADQGSPRLVLFFPQLDLTGANYLTAVAFMLLGSFSFVGIGMMAAILPLLYVERGAQMTFVLQSCLLLISRV